MITAVDTNVLIDVLEADPTFGQQSADALRRCSAEGRIVACEIVWAEVASLFPSASAAEDALGTLQIDFDPVSSPTALAAGDIWRAYRQGGGQRERLVSDFLIGATRSTRPIVCSRAIAASIAAISRACELHEPSKPL